MSGSYNFDVVIPPPGVAYATAADVSTYTGIILADLPADIDRLINRASDLIYYYIFQNYNSEDTDDVLAVKNATCAQVESWINGSESTEFSNGISEFTASKITVKFGSGGSGSSSGTSPLCIRAYRYLQNEGLLFRGVISR